jgi:hypothetical protein
LHFDFHIHNAISPDQFQAAQRALSH